MSQISPIRRSKGQARRYYDRISKIYDWLTATEKDLIQKGVRSLSPQPGEHILEIGCGTGRGLTLIIEALSHSPGSTRAIVGLDLSHQMLLQSREKSGADLIQGDAAALPVRSDRFDAIFCSFTLELFSEGEIPIVLAELRRALTPEGRLVVIALVKPPENLAVRLYELAHRLFPVAIDCRPIPLIQILANNGFQVNDKRRFMNWGLPVEIVQCKQT